MGDYEKRIIYISSDNSNFISDSKFNIVFDLAETMKDVAYIKVMRSEIMINVTGIDTTLINDINIRDSDPVFITLNDYNRISTRVGDNTIKFFDLININLSEKFGNNVPSGSVISFKNSPGTPTFNPYNSDTHILLSDNNFSKFNIALYDKHNEMINRDDIVSFNMTICLYSLRKKVSQL
jgi:hypothetical protein